METYIKLTRLTYEFFFPLGMIFSFAIGSCIGSFLNVCIWRIPRGENLSNPPSHCPSCNYAIPIWYNIPIAAWLILGGKCKNCKTAISPRYIIIEAVTGIIFVLMTYRAKVIGFPIELLLSLYFLMATFITITFIDLKHLIIPSKITTTGVITGLCLGIALPYTIITPINHEIFALSIDQQWMLNKFPKLAEMPRVFALIFSISGFIIGYGMVWLVVEGGKLLFGKQTFKYDEPIGIMLNSHGAQAEGDELLPWDDMFDRESDVLIIHVEEGNWKAKKQEGEFGKCILTVNHEGLKLGEKDYKLNEIKEINLKSAKFIVPREAMGRGDIKMLGMVGIFLGPVGAIFTLMFATFAGCLVGILGMFLGKITKGKQIPFGPYLAAAAAYWMLFWPETVNAYNLFIENLSDILKG